MLPDGVHDFAATLVLEERDLEMTVHPAAVETDRGLLVLDAGWPGAVDQLADNLADAGFDWGDVWGVALTHQDADHAGGLADITERADPVVFAHRDCAPYVDGREHPVKIDGDERYPAVPVAVELTEGTRFRTTAGPMDVYHTPGHAPGHVSYHFPDEQFLVSGDALHAPEGDLAGPRGPIDEAAAVDSIGALAALDVERTLTYHGGFVDHDAGAIERIRADADGDLEDPNTSV